MISFIWY